MHGTRRRILTESAERAIDAIHAGPRVETKHGQVQALMGSICRGIKIAVRLYRLVMVGRRCRCHCSLGARYVK